LLFSNDLSPYVTAAGNAVEASKAAAGNKLGEREVSKIVKEELKKCLESFVDKVKLFAFS
jgi:hypothetical protein